MIPILVLVTGIAVVWPQVRTYQAISWYESDEQCC